MCFHELDQAAQRKAPHQRAGQFMGEALQQFVLMAATEIAHGGAHLIVVDGIDQGVGVRRAARIQTQFQIEVERLRRQLLWS